MYYLVSNAHKLRILCEFDENLMKVLFCSIFRAKRKLFIYYIGRESTINRALDGSIYPG
jgi:hypothetical protein